MTWRKLGLVVTPEPGDPLRASHAMLPTPILLGDTLRVYFGSCDAELRGRIFCAELDRDDPTVVRRITPSPVFGLGDPGCFDADGVIPTSLVESDGRLYLAYAGFERFSSIPYTLLTGLAVSDDGGESFERVRAEPILGPLADERYFRTAAFIRAEEGSWRLWYIGGDDWLTDSEKPLPVYSLKHLRSDTLFDWSSVSETLIAPDLAAGEIGFGRPWITLRNGRYEMSLSIRRRSGYSLVTGHSADGLRWTLEGPAVETGPDAWDSEMVCYGATIDVGGHRYLFYNGNQFGRTGFGVAIEE